MAAAASGASEAEPAVMSSGGMTVSDYIDQPGLLVADAWLTELPLVASGRGSISGDAATLVQASDLFECEDAATCSRHINRDLGLLHGHGVRLRRRGLVYPGLRPVHDGREQRPPLDGLRVGVLRRRELGRGLC